ncbi:MAG: Crp/Fnr family transcriptional regulator [Chromatiales bacterium]|nr:Crp/Fnr family transcriptional regulator [Chromatiales bacterium]
MLKLYNALSEEDRRTLEAFAEFLAARDIPPVEEPLQQPKLIERPKEESVVAAIKRLSAAYYMLDKSLLFNDTSTLMTAHIIQGRAASDVIDELESLFQAQYKEYLSERRDDSK